MMNKFYNLAIVCGRFQPLHDGHVEIIEKALSIADKVGLYIGSANNTGTANNPFTYEERYKFIQAVFAEEIENGSLLIKPLNDREHPADDLSWGKYYLECIHKDFGKPDVFVYGNDKVRSQWFTEDDLKGIDTLIVNRKTNNISATQLRAHIHEVAFFTYNTPAELWPYYEMIRNKINEVNKNGK